MHGFDDAPAAVPPKDDGTPWWRELNRYHWFVLAVAALGWLFDTMDQQLFVLARDPALRQLLAPPGGSADPDEVRRYAGIVTSIFLIGWAAGGLGFGILGDRWGRARVMLLTILVYSVFTGLSALSWDVWSFAIFRFLTGLGVGGEFAVGVSLVAEIMPARARPFALGLLQALSAVGNITAAVLSIILFDLESSKVIHSAWRIMFLIGAGPALLAILIRRKLKEPERWQALTNEQLKKKLGSYGELFGHPVWRRNAIVGLLLAFAGVVGLWGIGFFSPELTRSVFLKPYEAEFRQAGEHEKDQDFVRLVRSSPELWKTESQKEDFPAIQADHLLGLTPGNKDPQLLFKAMTARIKQGESLDVESVIDAATKSLKSGAAEARERMKSYLKGDAAQQTPESLQTHADRISSRNRELSRRMGFWTGITSIMLNLGAFFGIYGFTYITHFTGRKPAFAVAFLLALLSTVMVFAYLNDFSEIFWMLPIMGFCQLSLFGGYAIYFPELFPTHLRSTGTSFCYNVGRFVAASGPLAQGYLSGSVFTAANLVAWGWVSPDTPNIEPLRYAGVVMTSIFLIGLMALPFAPETKGRPLPE